MRKNEQRLWDRMRKAKPPDVRLERIENGVGIGTPDISCLANGFPSWVELKAQPVAPKRTTTPVLGEHGGLSIGQKNWHLDWFRNGGNSFILVAVGTTQFLFPGHYCDVVNIMTMQDFNNMTLARDWDEVFERLRGL